jgi:hypothetical protein
MLTLGFLEGFMSMDSSAIIDVFRFFFLLITDSFKSFNDKFKSGFLRLTTESFRFRETFKSGFRLYS